MFMHILILYWVNTKSTSQNKLYFHCFSMPQTKTSVRIFNPNDDLKIYFNLYSWVFSNRRFFVKKQSQELTRVNPDRNIFSINVELTSTFLLYRGLVHHHYWILNVISLSSTFKKKFLKIIYFPLRKKWLVKKNLCLFVKTKIFCNDLECCKMYSYRWILGK